MTAFDHRGALKQIPAQPGVYRMLDAEGEVLYVGKAKDLKLSLIHISEPTRQLASSRMPSSA